jgi:hypothetical protein
MVGLNIHVDFMIISHIERNVLGAHFKRHETL